MSYRCPVCKQLKFGEYHRCPPRWYALIADVDEEFNSPDEFPVHAAVFADSPSEAAEKRVAAWDDGELAHKGDEIVVTVYDCDMENSQRFSVQGDVRPVYYAVEAIEATPA